MHSLQVELEGTRASVDKLERRLDTLCGDVKNIGSTMQQLLQIMGQQQQQQQQQQQHQQQQQQHQQQQPQQHQPLPFSKPPREQKLLPQAEAHSPPVSAKLCGQPVNQVKTYMRDAPARRVLDRQRSVPGLQQGASPLLRQSTVSAGRPQFFFGASPDKECFNDIFTTACTRGTCGVLRGEFSPPSLAGRGFPGGGAARGPSPTLSPLSQEGSASSHAQLLLGPGEEGEGDRGGEGDRDEDSSAGLLGGGVGFAGGVGVGVGVGGSGGGGGDLRSQYYKLAAGSDSEHDLLSSTHSHSSSCSPQTPLSPYPRPDPRSPPSARFKLPAFRRRGGGPALALAHPHPHHHHHHPHHHPPGLHRQTSVSLPDPPFFPDRSSGSEESLAKSESLPLEPLAPFVLDTRLEEIRAPLSRAESFTDLVEPQDSTEL